MMKNVRNVFGRVACGLLVAGGLLSATAGAAGSPALETMSLSLVGEAVSPAFSLYLGPGYRMPGSGVGSSQSASFAVYLGPLRQTYALSPAFSLDTRIPAALAGVIRASGTGVPLAGATVELFLGSIRQQVTTTNSAGEYTFYATIFGDYVLRASIAGYAMGTTDLIRYSGGQTIQASLSLSAVGSQSLSDLAVGPTDLTYTVIGTGTLTLTAMIHNNGGAAASNIRVRFYDASTGSGINSYVPIEPDIILASLAPGDAKPASVSWTPPSGHQRFYVFVDPVNAIQESTEINNGAARDLGALGRVPPIVAAVNAQYDGISDPRLIGRFLTGIEGADNRFYATVSDQDGDLSRVKFDFNGVTVEDTNPSDGWSVPFDTGTLPTGNLPLTVTAYDKAGLASEPFVTTLVVQAWPWWMPNRFSPVPNLPARFGWEAGYLTFTLRLLNNQYPGEPFLFFEDVIDPAVLIIGSSTAKFSENLDFTFSFPLNPTLPWKIAVKASATKTVWDHQDSQTDLTVTAVISPDGSVLNEVVIDFNDERLIQGFPEVTSPPLFIYGIRVEVGLSMDAVLAMHLSGTLSQNLTNMNVTFSPRVGGQVNGVLRISDPIKFARLELILSPRFELGPQVSYIYPPGDMSLAGIFSAEVRARLVGSLVWNIIRRTFLDVTWGPWEWTYPRQTYMAAAPSALEVALDQAHVPEIFPYPAAASGNAGQIGAAWVSDVDPSEQRIDPEVFFAARDTLGIWGAAERVTTNNRFETTPVLSFLADGREVAAWVQSSLLESEATEAMTMSIILDRQDIWYAIRGESGWGASAPVVEDAAPSYKADGLPALGRVGGGAMLLWVRSEGDSALAPGSGEIYFSVLSGTAWSTPQRITEDQADDVAPAVCSIGADSALAVWLREEPAGSGDKQVVWSVWDGSAWSSRQTLRDVGWNKQGPSLARTRSGGALATWVEIETLPDSTLRYHLLATRKSTGETAWGTAEEICADSLFIETPIALIDSRNIAAVTWRGYDGYDGDLKVALKDLDTPGSSWSLPRAVTADTLTDWMATAALDGDNNLHIIDLKSNIADTTSTPPPGNFFNGLSVMSRGISNDLDLSGDLNFGFRPLSADLLLAPGFLSVSDSHPIIGDTVVVSARVENIGDVRSVVSAVRFYEGHPDSGGVALGSDKTLPPIDPDSTVTVTTEWEVTPGARKLYAVADPAGLVPEQNEGNNMTFVSLNVTPDLVVSRLTISDPNPVPGDSVDLGAVIRNNGGAAAESFAVRFGRLSGTLATISGLSVSPADSITVSARFASEAGLDTLTVIADPDSLLPDPDRTNNRAILEFRVLSDLSVYADSIVYVGTESEGTLSAVIRNDGGVASPSFLMSFYRGNPLAGGVFIDSLRVGHLDARAQLHIQVPWAAPLGLSTVYVVADAGGAVADRDRGNNEAFSDVIRGALADIAVMPGTLGICHIPGDSLMLEVAVANLGNAHALGVAVEFFRGDPDSAGALIADRLIVALDKGATTIVSVPWVEPDSLDNLVFVVVDRADAILELSENNNRASQQFGAVTGVDEEDDRAMPAAMALHQPYPNPFNATITIRFDLAVVSSARLAIYDVTGRLVRTLVLRTMQPGFHSITWGGTNERGRGVASGIYFCRLEANGTFLTRKIVLIR